jgi:Protein of unknown function (DUF4238)
MATNKNQHFVPRVYLKSFSMDGQGAAISLFNVDHERFIPAAPLKHQCSGDYFYGEDLHMEKALQKVEGRYAELVRELVVPGYALSEEHRDFLRQFWLIQHLRTEAASMRMVQFTEQMRHTAGIDGDEFRMGIKEAVQHSMSVAIEQFPFVQDMKVCLLRNRTNEPFIVSDDPAVLTNRWHLDSLIPRGKSFGLGAAGSLFLLPITPKIQCVAYDGDVYSVSHEKGWVDVRRAVDVHAINQHQFLNCNANVYMHDKVHEQSVRLQFTKAKKLRPVARHRAHYAVYDGTHDGASRFRVVESHDDSAEHENALIHIETIHPRPAVWPTQIGRRHNGAVFTDGTGLGFVRRIHLDGHGADRFKKLRPW